MAIAKRIGKDGKPRFTVSVNVPPDYVIGTPNLQRRAGRRDTVGTFPNKTEAGIQEGRAKDAIRKGDYVPSWVTKERVEPIALPKVPTVADAVDVWMATKKLNIEANTANGYQSAIDRHLKPALGHILIPDLTHDDIQRTVNQWRDAKMGAQLIHRSMLILRASLARQVKAHAIPYNVAEGVEKPSVQKRRSLTIWTPQQMAAFLDAGKDDVLFPFWHLTLLEGMRRSEALGLRWSDIHWSADESKASAAIQQTVIPDLANGGKALIQSRTKTKAGARTVVLTDATIDALKLHRDRQRSRKQGLADVWPNHDLIVTNGIGGVVNPSVVKTNRIRLMAKANVPPITTHDLRHCAATIMLTSGTPPVIVSQKIGHSSIATTADLYGHVMPSEQSQANNAMTAYLARASTRQTDTEN